MLHISIKYHGREIYSMWQYSITLMIFWKMEVWTVHFLVWKRTKRWNCMTAPKIVVLLHKTIDGLSLWLGRSTENIPIEKSLVLIHKQCRMHFNIVAPWISAFLTIPSLLMPSIILRSTIASYHKLTGLKWNWVNGKNHFKTLKLYCHTS